MQALTYITEKLSIEKLPEYSRDDARDILEELQDDLKTCKENLSRNHLMHEFRQCAHEQLEAASNKVWEFTDSINEADSSSSGVRSMFVLVIPLNVICGFIWSAISCRITSQIWGWVGRGRITNCKHKNQQTIKPKIYANRQCLKSDCQKDPKSEAMRARPILFYFISLRFVVCMQIYQWLFMEPVTTVTEKCSSFFEQLD